ncbi:MAG: glutamine--tRNA ligase/YqeY domain fusion protein [Synergistota bacterium]|nr:glutamine--tRNA ligase/YqeY domain fusion protein [Synergistota bacterium]
MNMEKMNQTTGHFIEQIIRDDIEAKRVSRVVTRFPPEPNGYLHIGHAKSICLNFSMAQQFGGECNLRFDDTNPSREETEYVESIKQDVTWLGFSWAKLAYASDYFEQFYAWAIDLIENGKAYVDHQSAEEIRENRGTLTKPGVPSPWRDRPVEENLELFNKMTGGELEDGVCVLRAKIDMDHPNLNMRDPVMYRILKQSHHRTGDRWCVYPMYDFAHGYEDAIEGVTHSICTLEFEDHRPLYDWFLDNVATPSRPRQYEFARLNMSYTVMSKRKLLELVKNGYVSGWDDPRMPTVSGLRRRGYTPESIRKFCREIGVSRANSMVDIEFLEYCIREELNRSCERRMAVLDPIKVVIENYPEGKVEEFEAQNNPEDPDAGSRKIQFGREIYIERSDFMEDPPSKYFRLSPGKEVRLKHTYFITCREAVRDSDGNITELRCVYDPDSRGGESPDGRKVKGTLHWVFAGNAVRAEVRLYENLFTLRNMDEMEEGKEYLDYLNPRSLVKMNECLVEPSLDGADAMERFQFLRHGYFCVDQDSAKGAPVFNRTVSLKDSWSRQQKKG